jgi:hypothetical protein
MSDAPPKQECPSCGAAVDPGIIECPSCGANVKSGESFERKVERAHFKVEHREKYARSVFVAVTLGFGLVILAGYFTQMGAVEFIRQRPDEFRSYARRMDEIDRLMRAGQQEEARRLGEELVEEMEQSERGVREGPHYEHRPTPRGKKFIANLRKKIERMTR